MRGCLTTVVFFLVVSGSLTFTCTTTLLLLVWIDPQAESPLDLQWYALVIALLYLIILIKLMVKVSRSISNAICDFLFGKENEE